VMASTERVGWWTERRFHHRASLCEPSDAKTTATARIHECARSCSPSARAARPPARERSFRPFRPDGVDGASQLVDRATVPPPDTIGRALRFHTLAPRPYTRVLNPRLCARIKNSQPVSADHEKALAVTVFRLPRQIRWSPLHQRDCTSTAWWHGACVMVWFPSDGRIVVVVSVNLLLSASSEDRQM
jgi:hypothetical protein